MALILNIETASQVCSVALALDGNLLALRESEGKNVHSSVITLFIEEVLKSAGKDISSLDAVAVSEGPGSYTGLRIGVATAKGLCYALGKPLITVSTLKAMAIGCRHPCLAGRQAASGPAKAGFPLRSNIRHPILYCPMLDARRMEVYCAVYDEKLNEILPPRAEIISKHSFTDLLDKNMILFAGEGAEKCKAILDEHQNALFLNNFKASAMYMIGSSEEKFRNNRFEDTAYFEPVYLKDFVAGKPRVKGLR